MVEFHLQYNVRTEKMQDTANIYLETAAYTVQYFYFGGSYMEDAQLDIDDLIFEESDGGTSER